MVSDFQEVIFNDVVELSSDKVSVNDLTISNYVSTENMIPNKGGINEAASLPSSRTVNGFIEGDTLFSNIRTYFEKVYFADFQGGASPDVLVFRTKDTNTLLPEYLYYVVSNKDFIDFTVRTSKGAKMPRGDKGAILMHKLLIPSIGEQERINKILRTLDKKIELNRKINQTLEEMAQAIFKSWFVDFDPVKAKVQALENGGTENDANLAAMSVISGKSPQQLETMQAGHPEQYQQLHQTASLFPNAMQDSELGEIPAGWVFVTFSEIAKLNTKSIKPNKEPEIIWEHYSIPAFDAGQQPSLDTGESIKSNKYIVQESAILSSKLNPSTERTWLPFIEKSEVAICSTEFMQFVPLSDIDRAFVYCTIRSQPFQHGILSRVTGTTGSRQRAQPKEVALIQTINPSEELKKVFNNQVKSWLNMIGNNQKQIKTLVELRDALLPKLLSGELQISTEDAA